MKDARIIKMERKIEVLTRQVSLTKQMITDLGYKKTDKLNAKLKEMKEPYACKNNHAPA